MTLRQLLYCYFGWFFLLLGLIGIVLPLLPHTPFLLLATACFAKGSTKINALILSNKYIGPPIQNWRVHKRITKKAKISSILWIIVSITISICMVEVVVLKIMLMIIGLLVSVFILTRKSQCQPMESIHRVIVCFGGLLFLHKARSFNLNYLLIKNQLQACLAIPETLFMIT